VIAMRATKLKPANSRAPYIPTRKGLPAAPQGSKLDPQPLASGECRIKSKEASRWIAILLQYRAAPGHGAGHTWEILVRMARQIRASYSTQLGGWGWVVFRTRREVIRMFGAVFRILDYLPGEQDLLISAN
jgi:hypothetical protein